MIVIFDLDKTITRIDTVLPFLLGWLRYRPAAVAKLPQVGRAIVRYQRGVYDNTAIKEQLFTLLMAGADVPLEQRWVQRFNQRILGSYLYSDAL